MVLPRRWWKSNRIYYLLAVFVALGMGVGLYLNHRMMNIHINSVRESKQWTARFNDHARLRQLALAIRASANDAFHSPDLDRAAASLKAAFFEFNEGLEASRQDLLSVIEAGQRAAVNERFEAISAAMQTVAQECERVIEQLQQQQPAQAAERMLKMSPYAVKLHTLLTDLDRQTTDLLALRLDSQVAEAVKIENRERLSAVLIALMVVCVLIYGGRMSKLARAHASQRRGYLRAMETSERRYRELVDSLNDVVFQTDTAGHWTFLSPAWQAITGFAVESSLGRQVLDYVHPDDRELLSLIHI